jgi:hypothetical protein
MTAQLILGVGAGRSGLASLAELLSRQPGTRATRAEPPLLPWKHTAPGRLIRERLARLRKSRDGAFIADAASFYLPYLEEAIAAEPGLRVIGLERPREEVVVSFSRILDESAPLPTNHWADEPALGWYHDPVWTRTFPQYEIADRDDGVRRYWREYHRRLAELAERFPENVRVFPMNSALNTEAGQRELLCFAGYPPDRQVVAVEPRPRYAKADAAISRPSRHPLDPARCAVLVPYAGFIHPPCEKALQALEKRGYPVWRVGAYAAIDQGRNQMATDALLQGYEETMWIDADMDFDPAAVDRLRAHGLPLCCGIYPQKGRRALTCHVAPGTPKMVFGREGGLVEVLYGATGFMYVRREVYLKIAHRLALPLANERFGAPMIPFFHPMLHPAEDGTWYLAEDFAFCQRARESGYKIVADTSLRLWHLGTYAYGWEDSGLERERYATFTLNFPPPKPPSEPGPPNS